MNPLAREMARTLGACGIVAKEGERIEDDPARRRMATTCFDSQGQLLRLAVDDGMMRCRWHTHRLRHHLRDPLSGIPRQ